MHRYWIVGVVLAAAFAVSLLVAGTAAAHNKGVIFKGVIGQDDHSTTGSGTADFGALASFPRPTPANGAVTDDDIFVNVQGWQDGGGQTQPTVESGDENNSLCNGTPTNPTVNPNVPDHHGKVCIYVSGSDHAVNLRGNSPIAGATGASRFGIKLNWDISGEGDTFVDATWVYRGTA